MIKVVCKQPDDSQLQRETIKILLDGEDITDKLHIQEIVCNFDVSDLPSVTMKCMMTEAEVEFLDEDVFLNITIVEDTRDGAPN